MMPILACLISFLLVLGLMQLVERAGPTPALTVVSTSQHLARVPRSAQKVVLRSAVEASLPQH